MYNPPREISVTTPVGYAFERMKWMLFNPFDAGKWFTIGFCAWLAYLGEQGGGSFNIPGGGNNNAGRDPRAEFDEAKAWVLDNLHWIIPAVIAVFLLLLAIGFVLSWLNCRGKFMFLHCVALNRADVVDPWQRYRRQGNSLFWFRLVLGLMGMAFILAIIAAAGFIVWSMFMGDRGGGQSMGAKFLLLAFLGFSLLSGALVLGIIQKFTIDFAVPIMYLRGKSCLEAWAELRILIGGHLGPFVLYVLFSILIHLAIGMMVFFLVIFTCCLAGCLMAIPYLGAVFMLPLFVFDRSYSAYFLAQFGPEFSVFPLTVTPHFPSAGAPGPAPFYPPSGAPGPAP